MLAERREDFDDVDEDDLEEDGEYGSDAGFDDPEALDDLDEDDEDE